MKLKKIIALMGVVTVIGLASCDDSSSASTVSSQTPASETTTVTPESTTTSVTPTTEVVTSEVTKEENQQLAAYKKTALDKLDEIINPIIQKITDADLKAKVQEYYDTEKAYINDITDLETAKAAAAKVVTDTTDFAIKTLKPIAIEKLNKTVNPLIEAITYEDLKTSVQTFYNTEIKKIDDAKDLDSLVDAFKEVVDDTKQFIKDETKKIVIQLKNKALEELDPYVTALIDKIPYDTLKTDTQKFYAEEKKKLEAVDTIEGIEPCVKEIKEDLEKYALEEAKKIAIAKLDETVRAALAKLPNEELKGKLTTYHTGEIAKLNAITKLEDVPTTLETVLKETAAYVKELLASTVKEYIARLTRIETATAYDYLPEAMNPKYQANIVNASDIAYDFTTSTNVSAINKAGYGEQWQMVVENINQSIAVAKVFNKVQTALSAAGTAIDIYITNSYDESMTYQYVGDGFTCDFVFDGSVLSMNYVFTKEVTVPVAGTVKPVIRMQYDLTNEAKAMYISLGDSYKVKYIIKDDAYEMASNYGITVKGVTASRTTYLGISKDSSGKTTGHIYEYTTLKDKDLIKACADFYVDGNYVSVVGNKASGMMAFDGYVNELYLANEGRLLGYEVREEKTISVPVIGDITGTYNTLWFNLWDITGIDKIKVTEKTDANESGRSTVDVYINDSTTLLSPTYNTKLTRKTSRKYDVELRSRFYYTYDSTNDEYVANEVEVPMMFIQEGENYESFTSDIKKDNNITASVGMRTTILNKILSDYDTYIDIFIENKELYSKEAIEEYLKQYS